MPNNNPNNKNNSDNGADKARRKIEMQKQNTINRAGSIYTERDRRANIKNKKVKTEFVGKDTFIRQRGRGFINTTTRFYVNWTPTKLIIVSVLLCIPYAGLVVFLHIQGLTIVTGILIAVPIMLLGIAWLVRWTDKNL